MHLFLQQECYSIQNRFLTQLQDQGTTELQSLQLVGIHLQFDWPSSIGPMQPLDIGPTPAQVQQTTVIRRGRVECHLSILITPHPKTPNDLSQQLHIHIKWHHRMEPCGTPQLNRHGAELKSPNGHVAFLSPQSFSACSLTA